jgi:hypothetical protein
MRCRCDEHHHAVFYKSFAASKLMINPFSSCQAAAVADDENYGSVSSTDQGGRKRRGRLAGIAGANSGKFCKVVIGRQHGFLPAIALPPMLQPVTASPHHGRSRRPKGLLRHPQCQRAGVLVYVYFEEKPG